VPSKRVITSLRGANASGKTTVARFFHDKDREFALGTFAGVKVRATLKTIPGLERPVLLVGTYDESKYSGCDKIKSKDAIHGALWYAALEADPDGAVASAHILFEGFYVSKSWGPYCELRKQILKAAQYREPELRWLWAFIHAPLELILERSQARRSADSRPIDPKELAGVVNQMGNSRRNAMQIFPKEECLTLDPTEAPEALYAKLVAQMALLEAGS
jgi:hypothetical protein